MSSDDDMPSAAAGELATPPAMQGVFPNLGIDAASLWHIRDCSAYMASTIGELVARDADWATTVACPLEGIVDAANLGLQVIPRSVHPRPRCRRSTAKRTR